FTLCRESRPCVMIEKDAVVGGLSKTIRRGDFFTDIGGHRFFSQNQYLYDMIADLLGERWVKVERLSRFYVEKKFFLYPVNLREVWAKMGTRRVSKIVSHYLFEKARKTFSPIHPVSFEEKVVSSFGRELAQMLMLDYTEKVWGLPCSGISSDWVDQRIKNLSLREIVLNAVKRRPNAPKTLVHQFFYPERGIGDIFETMRDRVLAGSGSRILFESRPLRLEHDGSVIRKAIIQRADEVVEITPGQLLASIPITEVISLLTPRAPEEIRRHADALRFRAHLSLFITLKRASASAAQWLYFPEKRVPFGRIMEPRNWSRLLSPSGTTSLLVEFFCWEGDELWKKDATGLLALALPTLTEIGFIAPGEIIDTYVHREPSAYPVYGLGYQEHLTAVKKYLAQFKNLQLIGRSGRFRYNNMDHAIETGILAARNIIEGPRYDLDNIASEKEYFERGYIRS
ncbi:MAG: FAD-dependent oxidoreductase, partial [Candidatus Omnitrophota bacterium]